MVKKSDKNGEIWHEPPYSSEEVQQLDHRLYVEPISVMIGKRPTTVAEQQEWKARPINWRIDPEYYAMMNVGEAIRGYIDVRNVSTWYKNFAFDAVGKAGSLFVPFDRPLAPDEVSAIRIVGQTHGMPPTMVEASR